ncbi:MAG: DUF4435 domain-containing protein, partial [Methanomassiliicoccaceae archaeon]|nr:DUF4435 domain-containing protein [Methanomassiliicoccaceae archaeon]
PPIFICDKRDLESMMLSSGALDDVLSEYAEWELLEKFEQNFGKISDVLARSAYPIGLLMFVSAREGVGLSFKDLDHSSFINKKTLSIDVMKMIAVVFAQSVNKGVGKSILADKISEEEETLDDPWNAVRGHDAVSVLAIGLSEIFGSYNSKNIKEGQVNGALRLAFGLDYFKETELYRDTLNWSKKNDLILWITQ